jgi:hypothetical protein
MDLKREYGYVSILIQKSKTNVELIGASMEFKGSPEGSAWLRA